MNDVRTLLTDEDYAIIAEILSRRGLNSRLGLNTFTPQEVKAIVQETHGGGEIQEVTRYYIALKRLTEEVLKCIHAPGSPVNGSIFNHAVGQASRIIGNEHIKMINHVSWDITDRRRTAKN